MNLPGPLRADIGQRLGLAPTEASFPPTWSGRREGLTVSLEYRTPAEWRGEAARDWVSVWIVTLRHPRLPPGLALEPNVGVDRPTAVAVTGDPDFDRSVRITGGPDQALAALDTVTRSRLCALFDQGCAYLRGGELSYWRGSREVATEPVMFGQDLTEASWVVGRWIRLDVISGLLQVARGDPLLTVRVEAAARLSSLAPQRLVEIRRTLDGLIDDRLGSPERREQLAQLLSLPVVAGRIETRLGWRRTKLLQKLEVAVDHSPTLLAHLGEAALIRLLEGGDRGRKLLVLEQLAARGETIEALKAISGYTEGLFVSGPLKAAARAAQQAIEPRIKAGTGSLSLVAGQGGGLAVADEGELSIPEDER